MRYDRVVNRAIVGLALATLLAGCGGTTAGSGSVAAPVASSSTTQPAPGGGASPGSSSPDTEEPAAPDSAGPADTASSAVPEPVTRKVGKTGWYDGFAITVDQVTATPGFGDGADIEINVTYVNLGTEADTPRGGAAEVDGAIADAFFDSPQIPGEGKAKGTIEFSLIPDRDQSITLEEAIDKVVLVYGEAGDNQTKIPLAAAGKVESVEPKTLTAGGTLAQGPINIEVVSGTLVPSYETGEEGKSLLNLRIKLTCLPGCSASGYNTGFEEFSVTGPDGSSVTADDRSLYCCDALYPETVSDDARNILTFVVALPGTGAYKLTYSNPSLTAAGTAPATLDLTA